MLVTAAVALNAFAMVVNPIVVAEVATSSEELTAVAAALAATLTAALKRRRGRPPKFGAPARSITMTLPESTLETLTAIDPDPSRAIVQLASRKSTNGRPPAELTVFGRNAIITVRPSPSLEHRAGLQLVPLPDGRALLSFDRARSIADVELLIADALDDKALSNDDRTVFEGVLAILKEARRSDEIMLLRRNIIVLENANGKSRGMTSRRVVAPPRARARTR
jgi:hypothetical protein